MNDVLAIYGISSLENIIYAEATPEGINMPVLNSEDTNQSFLMVDYPTAIRLLDEGRYDDEFPTGLSPLTERIFLANNVEAVAIQNYGVETGLGIAVRMYEGMMEISPEGCMYLSSEGREELARLYDSFIKTLKTDGLPATPVMH